MQLPVTVHACRQPRPRHLDVNVDVDKSTWLLNYDAMVARALISGHCGSQNLVVDLAIFAPLE